MKNRLVIGTTAMAVLLFAGVTAGVSLRAAAQPASPSSAAAPVPAEPQDPASDSRGPGPGDIRGDAPDRPRSSDRDAGDWDDEGTPPPPGHRPDRGRDQDRAPFDEATQARIEAQLQAAREELARSAREVAALSSQLGRPLIERMTWISDGAGPRALLGLQLDPRSERGGARVREVSPGGAAEQAGMRTGDVIVAVNGTEVKGEDAAHQVLRLVHDVEPDSKVKVRVLRDGKPLDFVVVARAGMGPPAGLPPPSLSSFPPPPGPFPDGRRMGSPMLIQGALADMELATLTPRLGHYFGTDRGVLVVRAPRDPDLKLEDGDVIVTIDGREPTSGSHATRIFASYRPGEKLKIRLVRDRRTLDIEPTLPSRPGHVASGARRDDERV